MGTCPRCDRPVDRLHLVPPGVITRELVETVGGGERATDLSVCRACLDELMDGGVPA